MAIEDVFGRKRELDIIRDRKRNWLGHCTYAANTRECDGERTGGADVYKRQIL